MSMRNLSALSGALTVAFVAALKESVRIWSDANLLMALRRYLPGVCIFCSELFGNLLKVRLRPLLSMFHAGHDEIEVFLCHRDGGVRCRKSGML